MDICGLMKNFTILLCGAALIGMIACTSYAKTIDKYQISEQQTEFAKKRFPEADAAKLGHGKQIYTKQCTECHKAFVIEKFGERKWKHEIDDMSPKAKLTDQEKMDLTYFVLSYMDMKQAPKQ